MALIVCVTHDTDQNNRTWMTEKTLESLARTVDWTRHKLVIVDNASCEKTKRLFKDIGANELLPFTLIENESNRGTAKAQNQGWLLREKGQHVCKIDNDVTISQEDWLDTLEECIAREPTIGIIGMKRNDLGQSPFEPVGSALHTELIMLPHPSHKHRWLSVEVTREVLATCCLFNSALLDKIGFLWQPSEYAWEDCGAAVRCELAGFVSCFWPHTEIRHLDPGGDDYCAWKTKEAERTGPAFAQLCADYRSGRRSIFHGPNDQ